MAVATRPKTVMKNDDLIDRALIIYHAPDLSEMLLEGHTGRSQGSSVFERWDYGGVRLK